MGKPAQPRLVWVKGSQGCSQSASLTAWERWGSVGLNVPRKEGGKENSSSILAAQHLQFGAVLRKMNFQAGECCSPARTVNLNLLHGSFWDTSCTEPRTSQGSEKVLCVFTAGFQQEQRWNPPVCPLKTPHFSKIRRKPEEYFPFKGDQR